MTPRGTPSENRRRREVPDQGDRPTSWTVAGQGALDLTGTELAADGYEIVVTPATPAMPVLLFGEGAEVWRLLERGALADRDLDHAQREVVVQLQEMGLAAGAGTSSSAPLTLSEPWLDSVFHELVYALVARVAEENDIPLLFIKGPTLHAQGLRSRKHSGDVDCWVRPGDDLRLARAMREWGWTPLMLPFTGTTVTHSLTLVAGEWGCAIDVHTSFPGMRLAPGEALQFLLDGAEHRSYAGVSAQTPSLAAHAVLSALHDMRPFEGAPPSAHAVASATAVLATAGDAVFDVIDRLDAGYVLREPLERAFGAQARRFESALPPKDWEMRFERTSSARNFKALKFVPLRMRLRALVRLVWPTAETTRIALSRPQASNAEVFAARIRRVGTSARKLLDGR